MFFTSAALILALVPASSVLAGFVSVPRRLRGPRSMSGSNSARRATPQPRGNIVPGKLRVTENSGVCETTPGVYQASGYADLTSTEHLWFWFFEARESPDAAPLVLWFNGGPGVSSMEGLFQEHGPCRISNDSTTVNLNSNSWTNNANIIYLDQPVGTGFSYGIELVGTSQQTASDMWTFLQIFLADSRYSKFAANDFAIWTESYGGHYAPALGTYILSQNTAVAEGKASGVHLNFKYLGIGNGLVDVQAQYPSYLEYAASNPYHATASSSVLSAAKLAYNLPFVGCKAQINACYNGGSNLICSSAQIYCSTLYYLPLIGSWDTYYVPNKTPDAYPPDLTSYLGQQSLKDAIGAESTWSDMNDIVFAEFGLTGDEMRNSRPALQTIINSGVRTLLYDGDADFICNYIGVEAMVDALQTEFTSTYKQQSFTQWTVDGQVAGQYKNAGTFSYLRIYGAGHEVPAYSYGTLSTGQAALSFFTQIMGDSGIHST